jgi:hypothetical protein
MPIEADEIDRYSMGFDLYMEGYDDWLLTCTLEPQGRQFHGPDIAECRMQNLYREEQMRSRDMNGICYHGSKGKA